MLNPAGTKGSKTELTLLMGRQMSELWNDVKMGRNSTREAVRAQKRGNEPGRAVKKTYPRT